MTGEADWLVLGRLVTGWPVTGGLRLYWILSTQRCHLDGSYPKQYSGWPVPGWLVTGWPVPDWLVPGSPVPGWPVTGEADWLVPGWLVTGWPVTGGLRLYWILSTQRYHLDGSYPEQYSHVGWCPISKELSYNPQGLTSFLLISFSTIEIFSQLVALCKISSNSPVTACHIAK